MIEKLSRRLKAGALQYVVFMALLIAILLATFLTLTYIQGQFKIKTLFFKQTIFNADQGFKRIANAPRVLDISKELILDDALEEKLNFTRTRWGLFDKIILRSTIKNNSFIKMGLFGGKSISKTALYLKDNNRPLVVVGDTYIQGEVFLPRKQVKRGNIGGHSYYGEQLIYGQIKASTENLPIWNDRTYIQELCLGQINKENMVFLDISSKDIHLHSFNKPTRIIAQDASIHLSDIVLKGNIIVQSSTAITIENSAVLEDVLLIAPTIEIKSRVKGNFQAFASKNIKVGANCELKYPTVLMVALKNKIKAKVSAASKQKEVVSILIAENTEIRGSIGFFDKGKKTGYNAQLLLEEGTEVYGELYCDKNIELKGSVYGQVVCHGFIAKQFGSVYQNHIYNGYISFDKLSPAFVGSFKKNTQTKVVKWLY